MTAIVENMLKIRTAELDSLRREADTSLDPLPRWKRRSIKILSIEVALLKDIINLSPKREAL